MSLNIPDVPTELTAQSITQKIWDIEQNNTMKLYNNCLTEIKKQVFPCKVLIENCTDTGISIIINKLILAGYVAQAVVICESEHDYQSGGEYNVDRKYITIKNPLLGTK